MNQPAMKRGRPRSENLTPSGLRTRACRERWKAAEAAAGEPRAPWAVALIQRLESLGYSSELGETWFAATERRYRERVAACEALDCDHIREPFEQFAREIVEAPSDTVRLSILAPMEMAEKPEPFREYPQYRSPIATAA